MEDLLKESVLENLFESNKEEFEWYIMKMDKECSENKELTAKKINKDLIYLIDNREELVENENRSMEFDNISINGKFTIVPIIASIDSLGLVVIVANDDKDYSNLARLMAKILSEKINIY